MSQTINGFHHVAMKVQDMDRSIRFYTDLLGMKLARTWGDAANRSAMIDAGNGNCVELFSGGPAGVRPDGHWLHLALCCSDTKNTIARLAVAGVEVTMQSTDIRIESNPPLPVRIAFFKGPDGEILELFQVM